jgi:hypothetical protein
VPIAIGRQKLRRTLLAPGQLFGPAGAGYQDSYRMLRPDATVRTGRVTQPPHIAGPLALMKRLDLT